MYSYCFQWVWQLHNPYLQLALAHSAQHRVHITQQSFYSKCTVQGFYEHRGHRVNYRACIHETMQETELLGDNYSRWYVRQWYNIEQLLIQYWHYRDSVTTTWPCLDSPLERPWLALEGWLFVSSYAQTGWENSSLALLSPYLQWSFFPSLEEWLTAKSQMCRGWL